MKARETGRKGVGERYRRVLFQLRRGWLTGQLICGHSPIPETAPNPPGKGIRRAGELTDCDAGFPIEGSTEKGRTRVW